MEVVGSIPSVTRLSISDLLLLQIYIGKIPNEIYEDTLIPLFEEVGKIWDLRLMMDPLTGKNRGYAFITFCEKNFAAEAAKKVCQCVRDAKCSASLIMAAA